MGSAGHHSVVPELLTWASSPFRRLAMATLFPWHRRPGCSRLSKASSARSTWRCSSLG